MSIESAADGETALAAAWRLQRTGNFVAAFDLAQEGLRLWPESQALEHLSILALASCGSTAAALEAFRAGSLSTTPSEDYMALEARLLKDVAMNGGAGGTAMMAEAAAAYERVAQRTDGIYSRENAALLWMLAGDSERALVLAASVVRQFSESSVPKEEQAAYFYWATLAEAALVLGDRGLLEQTVIAANPLCRQNSWARSRTYMQMRRLSGVRANCMDGIEQWFRPAVGLVLPSAYSSTWARGASVSPDAPALAYCFGQDQERDWEELSALGVQLHAVYPTWLSDLDASVHRDSLTWSSLLLDEREDRDRLCADTALGLSLGHADAMCAPWVVLSKSGGRWRRYRDVDWRTIGAALTSQMGVREERARYAFLFADAVSYSSLNALDTRRYWTRLLPVTAAVLRRHSESIVLRKTWGDAIHAVFLTAAAAAAAALEMQAATAQLCEELEPGRRLSYRMAVHYGSADRGFDPVEEAESIFGPQLSLAARIVPVAPPGAIFVTEPFAAQLSLEGAGRARCAYVGTTSLAKGYGRVRLLTLA